jgi:hypothetical protein
MVPWVRTPAPEDFGAAEAASATFGRCSNVSESIVMSVESEGTRRDREGGTAMSAARLCAQPCWSGRGMRERPERWQKRPENPVIAHGCGHQRNEQQGATLLGHMARQAADRHTVRGRRPTTSFFSSRTSLEMLFDFNGLTWSSTPVPSPFRTAGFADPRKETTGAPCSDRPHRTSTGSILRNMTRLHQNRRCCFRSLAAHCDLSHICSPHE